MTHYLAYVDDLSITEINVPALAGALEEFFTKAGEVDLKINAGKSRYMRTSRTDQMTGEEMRIGN